MRKPPADNSIRRWEAAGLEFTTSRLSLQRSLAERVEEHVLDSFNEMMCGHVLDLTNKRIYRARLHFTVEVTAVEEDIQRELEEDYFPEGRDA